VLSSRNIHLYSCCIFPLEFLAMSCFRVLLTGHSLLLMFKLTPCFTCDGHLSARTFLLLAAVVWRVLFCRNDAFHLFSLLYFSLIHFNYYIFSLIMPLRCRQTWYSWSYGYLNLSTARSWRKQVSDAESLLSIIFLLFFFCVHSLAIILALYCYLYCVLRLRTLGVTDIWIFSPARSWRK
jgi:hypothetical protein